MFLAWFPARPQRSLRSKSQATSSTAAITAARDYEDPRIRKLAELLVNYSVSLKKGEKIILRVYNENSVPLTKAIIDEVYRIGAIPYVEMMDERLDRALYLGATAERYQLMLSWDILKYGSMNAIIKLIGKDNDSELSDVPAEKINLESKYWWGTIRTKSFCPNLNGAISARPSAGMAQAAGMSTEAFTDFYFRVCTMDYGKLAKAMDPLVRLMKATDKVRIIGPGTDLTFSIKDIPVVDDRACKRP